MVSMTIKELEEQLLISRANIRFYEKEGLLSPARKENKYRDYGLEDISRLKKVIVLRKLGVSVTDIKNIFDGIESLQNVINEQTKFLDNKIEELNGALDLCKQIENDKVDIESFNEAYYFSEIHKKESQGQSFFDIHKDYLDYELIVFDTMLKYFFHYFKLSKDKRGLKRALLFILFLCILKGLGIQFLWSGSFLEGFLYEFFIFAKVSVILLTIYILKNKLPRWLLFCIVLCLLLVLPYLKQCLYLFLL